MSDRIREALQAAAEIVERMAVDFIDIALALEALADLLRQAGLQLELTSIPMSTQTNS